MYYITIRKKIVKQKQRRKKMKLHSIDEQKVLDFSETLNTGKFEYSTRKTLNRSETEIDQEWFCIFGRLSLC
jgi:hypothetical protein